MRYILALILLIPSGCAGSPTDTQIQSDLDHLRPGCKLDSAIAAENSGEDVWMDITYHCPSTGEQKNETLFYVRQDGQWHVQRTEEQ